ncbi:divalent-cation tolerance protein CutA isoform X2 [Hyalella azteca]|nr:divalent-cation tolerance protein CutA isoform X2 [Hyalella azteca]
MSLFVHAATRGLFSLRPLTALLPSLAFTAGMASSSETSEFSVTYVTAPNMEVAKTLARGLVGAKLAACVNIVSGVTSVYEWQGKMEEDAELLLVIKTRAALLAEVTEYVVATHPYDVCEVLATPVTGGNPPYLAWLGDNIKSPSK